LKNVGIICEYNPFHLGHSRQIQLIRQQFGADTTIVGIMSGNYVQRGLPAMWDKSVRAEAAVRAGMDLILELPITGVLQSAEGFARTGVEILTKLGCMDVLCFGAECGDAQLLMDLAARMDRETFSESLHSALDAGFSYAAARQAALQDTNNLLRSPNNILGLEYCRAILHLQSPLVPFAVHRNGDYHATAAHEAEPSATAVRRLYPSGNWSDYMPPEAAAVFADMPWYDLPFGERAFLARLRGMEDVQWAQCAHCSEGLWSKAMKVSRLESSYERIVDQVKSKRYPRTRIQRLLLCAYLGITAAQLEQPISYVRILAGNERGRKLLRTAKKQGNLTLINAGQMPPDPEYYRMECRAADLFTLFTNPVSGCTCASEQNRRVILLPDTCKPI